MKAVDYFEMKNKTTPCPYCKSECKICVTLNIVKEKRRAVHCTKCTYCSIAPDKSPKQAIIAHEKICERLDLADKAQKLLDKPPKTPWGNYDSKNTETDNMHIMGFATCWRRVLKRLGKDKK